MKTFIGNFILLLLLAVVLPAAAQNGSPDALIKNTVDEVVTILKQDNGIREGNQEKVLNLVREKILPHFNFTRMTQLAMGRNWSQADQEQKKSLVKEFRTLLVRTYSNSLTTYRDEVIKVSPANVDPQDTRTTVRTLVIQGSGKQPVPIDYAMEKSENTWKVYDVIVSGVSLVTNYRGTFNSQIRNGGVNGLIAALAEKNVSVQGK